MLDTSNKNVAKSQKESELVMIKPIKRQPLLKVVAKPEPTKETKKSQKSKKKDLPSDAYKDEIEPIDLKIDDTRKFVLSVKRGGEFGLPMCDIRQFQTTELYEGFTKKGVNFPLVHLPDLIELLQVVYSECEEKGLLEEFEEDEE